MARVTQYPDLIEKLNKEADVENQVSTPEESAEILAKKKKEEEENIRKKLNDPKFLNFLQKNPEAVNNSTDNEYLKEKIEVFERVQAVKQEVKKFIVGESGSEFGAIVDDSFLDSIEGVAIHNPEEFIDFSQKITKYLESVNKTKSLGDTYKKIAQTMGGMEVNLEQMSLVEKRQFIEDVHNSIDLVRAEKEEELDEAKKFKNRKLLSYVMKTSARAEWKGKLKELNDDLEELKNGESQLNKDAILQAIQEMEGLKNGLRGNQALEIVQAEFSKKAKEKITTAITSKDSGTLSKQQAILKSLEHQESLLDDDEFDALQAEIIKYSKNGLESETGELINRNETNTLNSFEKGIDSMRKKGLTMGLTVEECNEQISATLRQKIEQLKTTNDPQSKIKIILATRILANLE